jgi:anti-anti-sigma factor
MTTELSWQHHVRTEAGRATVTLSGEIDMTEAGALQHLLETLARSTDAVDVDLAAVRFIDSTVISALIVARNAAADHGHRLSVINPRSLVRRVLDVTGVLDTLTTHAA